MIRKYLIILQASETMPSYWVCLNNPSFIIMSFWSLFMTHSFNILFLIIEKVLD